MARAPTSRGPPAGSRRTTSRSCSTLASAHRDEADHPGTLRVAQASYKTTSPVQLDDTSRSHPQVERPALSVDQYLALRDAIVASGFEHEVAWSESIAPAQNALVFWSEFAWVVLNSGMKNQVARRIWVRVRPAVLSGGSASDVFGHRGKAAAIEHVYHQRDRLLVAYQASTDPIAFLRTLPWIGSITCWHLAKNYGFDCTKPDRHLVRIAGQEGVDALCRRLASATGHRVATVDLVIWRAANLGLI